MADLNRTKRISIRFRDHELSGVKAAAKHEKKRVSEFLRDVVLDAASRRLARAEKDRAGGPEA